MLLLILSSCTTKFEEEQIKEKQDSVKSALIYSITTHDYIFDPNTGTCFIRFKFSEGENLSLSPIQLYCQNLPISVKNAFKF
jgi:hypothetical protein